MKSIGPTTLVKLGTALLSAMMLVTFLIPAATAEAQYYGTPCPHYSIQDVFDDPSGNWDGDQVNNADELYNGMNPCIVDTHKFCSTGGVAICYYPTYSYTYPYAGYPTACQLSITTYPTGDYDGDGITNADELRNGANPCALPCPNPTHADLSLNPNGDWDGDGTSNAVEINRGTNPCSSHYYNPCPYYSASDVQYMPNHDWDGDGVINSTETYRGTNPCVYNHPVHHAPTVVHRLPHVAANTVIVKPVIVTVRPSCPTNYPYYHTGNGLCYANPVSPWY